MQARITHVGSASDLRRLSSCIQNPCLGYPILVISRPDRLEDFSLTRGESRAIAEIAADVYLVNATLAAASLERLSGGARLRLGGLSAWIWWPRSRDELSDQLDLSRPAVSREISRLIQLLSESQREASVLRAFVASHAPAADTNRAGRGTRANSSNAGCESRDHGVRARRPSGPASRGRRPQSP
jgi:hypothetical protein